MIEKSFTEKIQDTLKNHQPRPITIPTDRINTIIVRIDSRTLQASILEQSGPFTTEHKYNTVEENINNYQFPEIATLFFGPPFKKFIKQFEKMVTNTLNDYFFTTTKILHYDEETRDFALLFRFIDKDDLLCD